MTDYPDTSFLCAVYRVQDNSEAAWAYRRSLTEPLCVSTLLVFEFRQAIRLQVWLNSQDKKKGYSQTEADQMLTDWESDIAAGHVAIIPTDADAVLRMAEHLSEKHTALTGNRTLDILHIATAKHLSAKNFLSFDARQKKLAKAAGLKTPL
jgi:predicted nucleic acid-binding protein